MLFFIFSGRPVDLPVPYQGQAMLHQDGQQQTPAGLTPSSSGLHKKFTEKTNIIYYCVMFNN